MRYVFGPFETKTYRARVNAEKARKKYGNVHVTLASMRGSAKSIRSLRNERTTIREMER
jgi:hypothetical protein